MNAIERAIDMLGWTLIRDPNHWPNEWRGQQRHFNSGPWRESPELVLADLTEMKRKDAEAKP